MSALIDIEGYEGLYAIAEDGRVFSHRAARYLKTHADGCGYQFVALQNKGRKSQPKVHVLVARAFVPNPNGLPVVNHIDGCKSHNASPNLEWVSQSQNILHAFAIGLACQKGERNAYAKLNVGDILSIREKANCGILQKTIAAEFGISRSTVCRIASGKAWTHVQVAQVAA